MVGHQSAAPMPVWEAQLHYLRSVLHARRGGRTGEGRREG
jgi:hypothetical protein